MLSALIYERVARTAFHLETIRISTWTGNRLPRDQSLIQQLDTLMSGVPLVNCLPLAPTLLPKARAGRSPEHACNFARMPPAFVLRSTPTIILVTKYPGKA